jgi:hypothetical protein
MKSVPHRSTPNADGRRSLVGLSQSETEEFLSLDNRIDPIDRDRWMALYLKHETAYRHLCLMS